MGFPDQYLKQTDDQKTFIAGMEHIDSLVEMVNLAYRGGKATVAWKNENHLVSGPRIVKSDLERYIASPDSSIIAISNSDNLLLACVQVEKNDHEAHIGMLSVHPEYQNLGLGKRLLQMAADYALNVFKCEKAKMCVFGGRDELLAWYGKMGYKRTGETMPFFGPESGLSPLVDNAHFVIIEKLLK